MPLEPINPPELGAPRGYSNGILCDPGSRLLFVAGQIGWDEQQQIVSDDFIEQFDRALLNLVTVVKAAGGMPANVARMVIYVVDKAEYSSRTREVGERWRKHMGRHFPAMALVEVKSLLENTARVEIEAIAAINVSHPS
jgi:enamine deaminase RidA (YjgF/YER057c/UK114 family)